MKKKSRVKKIIKITAICLAGLIIVSVITAAFILYGRIATMISLKHVGDNLYTMNFRQDYHLDKALSAEIDSEQKLIDFICDEMLFGYKPETGEIDFACTAFSTKTPDGKYCVGRNFDVPPTEAISIYTHPSDGYSAIATASSALLGIGAESEISTDCFTGKASLLAAPYFCVDGVNEKGLSASTLDVAYGEVNEDNAKPDLVLTLTIRMLLDRAADVDEAVALLEQYDMHMSYGWIQHIFISDATGKSVVVDWQNGKMNVSESAVCTNFRLSTKTARENPIGNCDRFDLVYQALKEKPENNETEMMLLLKKTKQPHTRWSVVYNLTDFTVDYAVNMDYDTVYRLSPKDY